MNPKGLFNQAKTRYEEEGIRVLMQRGVSFGLRKGLSPIVEKAVRAKYGEIVVDYSELESRCAEGKIWRLEENPNNLREEHLDAIVPLQDEESVEFVGSPIMEGHHPYVAEVPDAVLFGPTAVPFSYSGRVIGELINVTGSGYNYIVGRNINSAILSSPYDVGRAFLWGSIPSHQASLATATVLYDEWNNFYHTILQQVPKLRAVSRYERATGNEVRLVIPADAPTFLVEALELLGYGDQIYEWDGEPTHVEKLVVPSFPEIAPRTVGWLRDQMHEVTEAEYNTSRWIHISRQKANSRCIENYTEIQPVLNKYGIESVICEEHSFEEQVRLFRSVEGIVGVHGAGLSNMIWGEKMTVLEIFHDYVYGPFYILADALDHRYSAISGKSIGKSEHIRNIDGDVWVDPSELDKRLNTLIG